MKVLLVYPEYPETFWSFKYALKFIFKKAGYPPLGLLTVASLLPDNFEKKLLDMNVSKLKDKDIMWADYVFISAMVAQRDSVKTVIKRCNELGVKVVAGGPLFATDYEEFSGIDHLILNEAEITLPIFLEDLRNSTAKKIYTTGSWADIEKTPLPRLDLITKRKYGSMSLQYSRGCPFNCEFCDITSLYGRIPRTKSSSQILNELEQIYKLGWRGTVFFVDDNFIGNKKKLKNDILPAIISWMEGHKYPFGFLTQASVELADDEELMKLMTRAGFDTVFVGIETPCEESLAECSKNQNKKRDLVSVVQKMQKAGLQVQAGFIVGFDSDPVTIFEQQIKFIQQSGIVTAMVGLLNAVRGTRLYKRLEKENRIVKGISGDNSDCSMNFKPKMNYETLIDGYKRIVSTIYSPSQYYERVRKFLKNYEPVQKKLIHFKFTYLIAFFRSAIRLGIIGKERFHYWRLVLWSLFKRPHLFPLAASLAIYGFHFRKNFEKHMC